jgi:hypothetical protein
VGIENHGRASLEAIVESGDLGLSILHPGGLEGTRVWPIGRVVAAEGIFSSKHLGYAIVVGRKAL